jgi:phospholipid transport system transporter-binding protein
MASFRIEPAGPGRLKVQGELGYATATTALRDGLRVLDGAAPTWTVDLAGVTAGDSAGLAVLVEWLSVVRARGSSLRYVDVPAQILAIARISGLDQLLVAGQPD